MKTFRTLLCWTVTRMIYWTLSYNAARVRVGGVCVCRILSSFYVYYVESLHGNQLWYFDTKLKSQSFPLIGFTFNLKRIPENPLSCREHIQVSVSRKVCACVVTSNVCPRNKYDLFEAIVTKMTSSRNLSFICIQYLR